MPALLLGPDLKSEAGSGTTKCDNKVAEASKVLEGSHNRKECKEIDIEVKRISNLSGISFKACKTDCL